MEKQTIEVKAHIWYGEHTHVMVDGGNGVDQIPDALELMPDVISEMGKPTVVNLVIELPEKVTPGMTLVARAA